MYLKHFQLEDDPFSKSHDTDSFFTGGGRERVLHHILEDLANGIALVHLNGAKGSGKTLLCQLIREKIHFSHTVVMLSESSGGFDETLRSVALALGEKEAKNLAADELYQKILMLIADRAQKGGILLIIDDAEEFKPDVLKSLMRLASDSQVEGGVQFVLSGRLGLGVNPELFSAIRSVPLKQFTYTLQPLDCEDSGGYLAYRLGKAGMSSERKGRIFTEAAVQRIHESTCGNIQFINGVAEESLRNAYRNKAPEVRAIHVSAPEELAPLLPLTGNRRSENRRNRQDRLVVSAVALGIIVTIFIYIMTGYRPSESSAGKSETLDVPVLSSTVPDRTPELLVQPVVVVSQLKPEKTKISEKIVVKANDAIVSYRSNPGQKEVKPAARATNPTINDKSDPVSPEVTPIKISAGKNKVKRFSGSDLLERRKSATRSWNSGNSGGQYTIQILTIKDSAAEAQLGRILDDQVYQDAENNLYFLYLNTRPMTIFVYYGEYKNIADARQARSRLPKELKKFAPFPLSIEDAVKKSRR